MNQTENTFNFLNLEYRFALNNAPVILGVKASCTFTVKKEEFEDFKTLLYDTSLCCILLLEMENQLLFFIYRPQPFQKLVKDKEIIKFLAAYEYDTEKKESLIEHLSQRFYEYYYAGKAFPHELGVFLGYPLEDVKEFIRQEGKGYLLCGYWKVYTQLDRAVLLFKKYNETKIIMYKYLEAGNHIRELLSL